MTMLDLKLSMNLKGDGVDYERQINRKLKDFSEKDLDKFFGFLYLYLDQLEIDNSEKF